MNCTGDPHGSFDGTVTPFYDEGDHEGCECITHQNIIFKDEGVMQQSLKHQKQSGPEIWAGPALLLDLRPVELDFQSRSEQNGQQAEQLAVDQKQSHVADQYIRGRPPVIMRVGKKIVGIAKMGEQPDVCAERAHNRESPQDIQQPDPFIGCFLHDYTPPDTSKAYFISSLKFGRNER
ncbi:hypothetical protein [Paenibacillus sp. DMB20]|uniref:hypothetical protein n=1 Tax=Paenibacillus sp. DMB20 TaxID=1642570 RepID=UPI002E131B3A